MNNMRRGFTMIELIFVIVIIGILAAVAIPKLSATRDDALDSKVKSNVNTCITDFVAAYTATGTADKTSSACTSKDAKSNLLTFSDVNGTMTVSGKLSDGNTYSKAAPYKGQRVSYDD